jgi:hypothetical protein
MGHMTVIRRIMFGLEDGVIQLLELISYETVFLRGQKPLNWNT